MLGRSVRRALSRIVETRADRDGQTAALEPSSVPSSWQEPEGGYDATVRHRLPGLPQDILVRSLSQKVLNGWLQNRHQTLVPLAMNVGRLLPEQVDILVNFAAVAVLGGSSSHDAGRNSVTRWLRSIGAQSGAIEAFDAAIEGPRPLSLLLQAVRDHELGPYAYAGAVVASDQREPSGWLFSNYVAARLALPADAVRSIDRRYRR